MVGFPEPGDGNESGIHSSFGAGFGSNGPSLMWVRLLQCPFILTPLAGLLSCSVSSLYHPADLRTPTSLSLFCSPPIADTAPSPWWIPERAQLTGPAPSTGLDSGLWSLPAQDWLFVGHLITTVQSALAELGCWWGGVLRKGHPEPNLEVGGEGNQEGSWGGGAGGGHLSQDRPQGRPQIGRAHV